MNLIRSLLSFLFRKLAPVCLAGAIALGAVWAEVPVNSFGVWDRGASFDPKQYPFLKGLSFNATWGEVERQSGAFDWSGLDQAVEKAVQRKMSLYLSLGVGPEAPEWIYAEGVPKVFTDDERHKGKWPHYPYPLAPAYKSYFQRLITAFGKHIRGYPAEKQARIAFIQVKTGCTGDECAYKGEPKDARYNLPKSSPQWRAFRLDAFALFVRTFQQGPGRPIDLLFNSIGGDADGGRGFAEEWDWVTAHCKSGFGFKNGALSRGHHLSGERTLYDQWTRFLIDPKGLTLFRRSEMDQTWTRPFYQLNLPLNFYWGALNALNGGQSVWDISAGAIEAAKAEGFDHSFHFFNRYAGQIRPESATGAFCALHKGLDAADTTAYPEAKFGKAARKNVERMLKICQQFSRYGARADDPEALTMGQVEQRREQKGFNDVGWDIWPDNYSRFLYQIDADATSVPLWRVGGPITPASSIYARFARGFEHASGKDSLRFKLHDRFFSNRQPKVVTVHVAWYDGQAGSSWKLVYDAGAPVMKTALAITGNGDKQWHDVTVTLRDAVLAHGGVRGSDLALVNTDDKDDVFSIIEVVRGDQVPQWMPAGNQPARQQTPSTKREERRRAKGK
ncbi:MAG: beta-galactosidase [Acidobacteria bacterium]|nr:beta-galactosidase [Acidobacteriota bacterium]